MTPAERQQRHRDKLKANRPVPEEIAKRDQQIQLLTTENRKMFRENRKMFRQLLAIHEGRALDGPGTMPYATYKAIVKALHPDSVWDSQAEKDAAQDAALKALTAWGSRATDRAKR